MNLFSTGGLSVFESFGLMGQGGLLIAAISSLKGQGKEMIQNFLQKKGVPRRFHIQLCQKYARPETVDEYKWLIENGQENLKEAKEEYNKARGKDSIEALNNLGRIALYEKDLVTAEAFLQIGLQPAQKQSYTHLPSPDFIEIEYQLNKNLGWAFLPREKYKEAEQKLKAAIKLDEQIDDKQIGGGMAYCLLGKVLTVQNNQQAAQEQFQLCQKYARPETVDEYKWLIENGPDNLAEQVDTTSIMTEEEP